MKQTMTTFSPSVTQSVMQLPIMRHYNQSDIQINPDKLKGGQKPIFWVTIIAVLGGLGYGMFAYVLPIVFTTIGIILGLAITGVFMTLFFIAAPYIVRWLKGLVKNIHKVFITQDPFAELYHQKEEQLKNQEVFRSSKGIVTQIRNDMQIEAEKSEKDANSLELKILSLQGKVHTLKTNLDKMVTDGGVEARESDEYVGGQAELLKLLSESSRVASKLAQSKDFVQKYGSRASVMKKLAQKLVLVEADMEVKIDDFDATIEMLKKDFEFGQKSKAATNAAKSAMLFTKSWELDYALDVVNSTIANDIAITAGNLKDIDNITKSFSIDSDDLYANLNKLADNIKVGAEPVPKAKKYNNPEYKLTESDKLKSGGFNNLFE
jgi:hypothetical protein